MTLLLEALFKFLSKSNQKTTIIVLIAVLAVMFGMAYEKHSARLDAMEEVQRKHSKVIRTLPKMMRSLTRIESKLRIPPEKNTFEFPELGDHSNLDE